MEVDPLEIKAVNTVRVLSADVVQKANSGHPGAPMGCAPIAHTLFTRIMRYSPENPTWCGRDRFVLSNGHACALLYTMLHLTGYTSVTMDDLKSFRQINSATPGHPENFVTAGVEVSTGPLGQGISNAVGMAIAESHLAAEFNREGEGEEELKVVDNYTYVLCGDGCLQEGVSSEACSLAGHLGLGKLIVLYDDNSITIDGETDLSFTEDVLQRYEAYGWHTDYLADANDLVGLEEKIRSAQAVTDKPSIIKVRTIIGFGSLKQGSEATHGAPLGAEDVKQVKTKFGFNPDESFVVDGDVAELYLGAKQRGATAEASWTAIMEKYEAKYPQDAAELKRRLAGELPKDWKEDLPKFSAADGSNATRAFSGQALNAVANRVPELIGGSADLTPSNVTSLKKNGGDYQRATPEGRYLRFGVREHGMTAVANGIFAYGAGYRPFIATFLNFVGYALGALRLSALSRFGVIFVATHDSIGLGEDGPTHQPVEMLESLRAMPNLYTLRPADGNETVGAYMVAMQSPTTPSVLALSRQKVPNLEGSCADSVAKGGYVLSTVGAGTTPNLILIGTGTEVSLCVSVAKALHAEDQSLTVRIVSMPCTELFDAQDQAYRTNVLPDGAPIMSIEAGGIAGWNKYAHVPFGMIRYGASGKGDDVYAKFGFTVPHLTQEAKKVLAFYQGKTPVSPINIPALDFCVYDAHGH